MAALTYGLRQFPLDAVRSLERTAQITIAMQYSHHQMATIYSGARSLVRDEANGLCGRIKRAGGTCFTLRIEN
jgi:hypothetical protein